jgi:hypothetical protein
MVKENESVEFENEDHEVSCDGATSDRREGNTATNGTHCRIRAKKTRDRRARSTSKHGRSQPVPPRDIFFDRRIAGGLSPCGHVALGPPASFYWAPLAPTLGSPLVSPELAGIGPVARVASADPWRRHFGWTSKGLRVLLPMARRPQQTRSFGYARYSSSPSKTLRTAVGRSICPAGCVDRAQEHRLETARPLLAAN